MVILALLGGLLPAATQAGDNDWSSFRGQNAKGYCDTQSIPATWNVTTGENIKWKTPIPGLAHSSPIVWGNHVYVTTSVSEEKNPYLKVGLYGASPDHPEDFFHDYKLYCLDKKTGKILWEKTAYRGKPQVKRHIKSSHANSSPATDGKHVLAFFGSEGLYCYDTSGTLLWKKNFGLLDAGAFNAPQIQWGFGSSPIIHQGCVIVQCDVNNQSFLASFDVETGKELWRTLRDEDATWSTPSIYEVDGKLRIACNGYTHLGGYDFQTGKEIWKMQGGGDIPVPTPVIHDDLIYFTNGHGGKSPVYAIRSDATGDITLKDQERSNKHIVWSTPRRGSYMQTPLLYRGLLYAAKNNGLLTVYHAKTGDYAYRKRIGGGKTGFSASPVAGDGKIYYTSEEGDILVLAAGPEYNLLATNTMDEICMATPAISSGTIFIRGQHHLFAIGK